MQNYNEFLQTLKNLLNYKSVNSAPEKDMPFGKECYLALNYFLSIARKFGFGVINYDNYAGEVYFGEGEEIGIIGHLDVVPESNGWDYPAFDLTIDNGKLIGRGVVDDKAPILLCLFALKQLKDENKKFNKKIRLFVGCNEETGWKDLEYLKSKTTLPTFGFSPDGDFPVCYAEKGVYYLVFHLPEFKNFTLLPSGTAINAVCGMAKAVGIVDERLLNKYNLKYEKGEIVSVGVTAHGSSPQKGVNAFKNLFLYMQDLGEDFGNFIDSAFFDCYKIFDIKNAQGNVTLSPNKLEKTKTGYDLYCDLRVPSPIKIDSLLEIFDKFYFKYSVTEKHPPVMVEPNGWFVNCLNSAYSLVTKKDAKPIAMGGSTFARAFKLGCAFGMFSEEFSGGCHEANEYVKEDYIKTAYDIYYNAILNLIK